MRGPRRRTLSQLLEVCGDPELFRALPNGHRELVVRREDLAQRLGVTRGTLYRRLRILDSRGLVTSTATGQLVVDLDGVRERLNPTVVAFPTGRTRQVAETLAEQFDVNVAADGTLEHLHADGSRASLDELSDVLDLRSRGTVQWHLQRMPTLPGAESPSHPSPTPEQPAVGPVHQINELLDDLAQRATELAPDDVDGKARIRSAHLAVEAEIATLEQLAIARARLAVDTVFAEIGEPDDALVARVKPIHDGPVARPKPIRQGALRDANAPPVPSDFEFEVENSAQTHKTPREPNAPQTRHRSQPAANRDFGSDSPGDWDGMDWNAITAPIVEAWADSRHQTITIADHLIDPAQQWPRSYLARAAQILAGHIREGRDIGNPGAIFNTAVREGRLDYFPTTPPPPAADPTLSRQTMFNTRADALQTHITNGVEPELLAHFTLLQAEPSEGADLELLSVLVAYVHQQLPGSDHTEFDTYIVDAVNSSQNWRHASPVTIEGITTAAGTAPVAERTAV